MSDKKELEQKMFGIEPKSFEAYIPKYESFPEPTPEIQARAKKGASGYSGKWVVLEHVKGRPNYIFSNGSSIGHAMLRDWEYNPADEGGRDPPHKVGFTRAMNSFFACVKSIYPDMVQMRMHVVSYSMLYDVSVEYQNQTPHHVVTDIFIGELSMKDQKAIVFTPMPFDRMVSFLTNPIQDVYGGKEPIKHTFVPPPVIDVCETLDEALEFKVQGIESKLPYVGSHVPVHSVVIRPETANLKLGPEKKKKVSSAVSRLLNAGSNHTNTNSAVVSSHSGVGDRLILKRKAPQASINELFTPAKMLKLAMRSNE